MKKMYLEIAVFTAAGIMANFADAMSARAAEIKTEECVIMSIYYDIDNIDAGALIDIMKKDGNIYTINDNDFITLDFFPGDMINVVFLDNDPTTEDDIIIDYYRTGYGIESCLIPEWMAGEF